ncbi:MAG: phosphotyrosine protein phosphatase [Methylococcaceae bacterium]|nr:phosphotyrosine protein phosphatase [Methylococcaceae bacterium]
MDAENIYQVFDWLWSSGQLSERDIKKLPSLEINAVINLALPTSSNALHGEAEIITGLGISYFHIPIEWEVPQLEQAKMFFDVLNILRGRKVWVHCVKNKRVSVFIYLYRRLCLSECDEAASYPMKQVWVPNETWQSFINQALNVL